MAELINFEVSTSVIAFLMNNQSGSLDRALVELVQNAVDASATQITIEITDNSIVISDNGCGFTKETIMSYFRIFGAGHKNTQQIGKFCLGRAQIMAYGKVMIHSHKHQMIVDIANKGYNFLYDEVAEDYNGTAITVQLYKHIDTDKLCDLLKFKIMLVTPSCQINGEELVPVELPQKTDNFSYDFKIGAFSALDLYYRGIFVCEFKQTGLAGRVNFLSPMEVNISRNEFISQDIPTNVLLNDLEEVINEYILTIEPSKYNNRLCRWVMSQLPKFSAFEDLAVISLVNESKLSFSQIKSSKYCFAQVGDIIGDKLLQMGVIVIDAEIEYLCKKFLLAENMLSFAQESEKIGGESTPICVLSETPYVQKIATLAVYINCQLFDAEREIIFEEKINTVGFTDGSSYIAINLHSTDLKYGKADVLESLSEVVFELLCHEYAHESSSKILNVHNVEFYERKEKLERCRNRAFGKLNHMLFSSREHKIEKDSNSATGYSIIAK